MYNLRSQSGLYYKLKHRLPLLMAGLLAILVIVGLLAFVSFQRSLQPVSDSITQSYFQVEQGSSTSAIALQLKQAGLIRNSQSFMWYVRLTGARSLQAGSYVLSPSLNTQQIIDKLSRGDVAKNLVTLLPGKRLDQLKKYMVNSGFDQKELDEALNPAFYKGHPALGHLPAGSSLEGYLYPDSYEKVFDTKPQVIIRLALDEMAEKLTPQLIAKLQKQGLNVHQAVILASIIDQEVSNPADKPRVAQVFLKRFRSDIPLGSDPTSIYASVLVNQPTSYLIDSPYNTRVHKGLPPGPIGNVTLQALEAVAEPADGDYLFFVSGDDGTTHFSKTQQDHEMLTKKYCTKLCQ